MKTNIDGSLIFAGVEGQVKTPGPLISTDIDKLDFDLRRVVGPTFSSRPSEHIACGDSILSPLALVSE